MRENKMMKKNYKTLISKLLTQHTCYDKDLISTKALFGGTGISYDDIMFGWVQYDEFYLRGHPEYLNMFIELKMEPLILEMGVTSKFLKYYNVTSELWADEVKLIELIQMVIDYSHLDKVSQRQVKESRIRDLPNMTLSLERSLYKVGINNIESFREHGAYNSYFKLKQNNADISKNILFALCSALMGKHAATLSDGHKRKLKNEYKEFALSNNTNTNTNTNT